MTATVQALSPIVAPLKRPVSVSIDIETLEQMRFLVRHAPKEVGWYCLVEDRSRPTKTSNPIQLHVHGQVYIYEQEVTGSEVDAKGEAIAGLIHEVIESGEDHTALRCHCHSHVNMGVSPSSTDIQDIKDLYEAGYKGTFVAMILNKKGEISCRVYDFDDNAMYTGITATVDYNVARDFEAEIKSKYKDRVAERVYAAQKASYPNAGGGYYRGQGAQQTHPKGAHTKKTLKVLRAMERTGTSGRDKDIPTSTPSNEGPKQGGGLPTEQKQRVSEVESGNSTGFFAVTSTMFLAEAGLILDDLDVADLAKVIRIKMKYLLVDMGDLPDIANDFHAICTRVTDVNKIYEALLDIYQCTMDTVELEKMMTDDDALDDGLSQIALLTQD